MATVQTKPVRPPLFKIIDVGYDWGFPKTQDDESTKDLLVVIRDGSTVDMSDPKLPQWIPLSFEVFFIFASIYQVVGLVMAVRNMKLINVPLLLILAICIPYTFRKILHPYILSSFDLSYGMGGSFIGAMAVIINHKNLKRQYEKVPKEID